MTKAIYYHAGCAICVEAERSLLPLGIPRAL
ncbi:thioredoxin family protein, partial [Pseudomonas aeruginosa]